MFFLVVFLLIDVYKVDIRYIFYVEVWLGIKKRENCLIFLFKKLLLFN